MDRPLIYSFGSRLHQRICNLMNAYRNQPEHNEIYEWLEMLLPLPEESIVRIFIACGIIVAQDEFDRVLLELISLNLL